MRASSPWFAQPTLVLYPCRHPCSDSGLTHPLQHNASRYSGILVDPSYCEPGVNCNDNLTLPSVSTETKTGDFVRVLGNIYEQGGTTTLASVAGIEIIEQVELPDPINITTSVGGGCEESAEGLEGVLVSLSHGAVLQEDDG